MNRLNIKVVVFSCLCLFRKEVEW